MSQTFVASQEFETALEMDQVLRKAKHGNINLVSAVVEGLTPDGETNNTSALTNLINAVPDGTVIDFGPRSNRYFVNYNAQILLDKNLTFVGGTLVGDDSVPLATKDESSLFVLSHDLEVRGMAFEDLGVTFDGARICRVGQSKEDVRLEWKRCKWSDCTWGVYLKGGSGDFPSLATSFHRIEQWTFYKCEFHRVAEAIDSRLKKFRNIDIRRNKFFDCVKRDNLGGTNNMRVVRIGQDHANHENTDIDLEFKTVDGHCIVKDNTMETFGSEGIDGTVYGFIFYNHKARFEGNTVKNGLQDHGGFTYTRPVSGVYFRGRDYQCYNNRFYDCSHGGDNGMVHVKAAGSNGHISLNQFECTEEFTQRTRLVAEDPVEPMGVSFEKTGEISHNWFRNVYMPIWADGAANERGVHTKIVDNRILQTIEGLSTPRFRLLASTNMEVCRNKFLSGGMIIIGGSVDGGRSIICDGNYFSNRTAQPGWLCQIVFQSNVLNSIRALKVTNNIFDVEREQGSDFIRVGADGNSNLYLDLSDNEMYLPANADTWSSTIYGIYITSAMTTRRCRILRNTFVNGQSQAIRFRGTHHWVDIDENHFEGFAAGQQLNWDGPNVQFARINGRVGLVTQNKGVASFDNETSRTISHGISQITGDSRSRILASEFELKPQGDSGQTWISGVTATQATINVPSSFTGNIAWEARRTNLFEDYS